MYPIPPGLYCVPAAIVAITGADVESVVFPAINRAEKQGWLCGPVEGVRLVDTRAALEQMGWNVRRYKHHDHHQVRTWAKLSVTKYPGHKLLVSTKDHVLALLDGKVYDTFTPYGGEGDKHPYAKDVVVFSAIVEPGPNAMRGGR